MSDQKDFEKLLPVLKALNAKEVRYPDMPVDQAVKEGEIMAAAAAEDAKLFAEVGFDAAKIDDLGAAVGALRFAQARLIAALGEMKEMAKQWAEEEPKAYALRAEILSAVAYALRDVQDAKRAIKRIREGAGHADMIQDLLALSEVGKKYSKHLQAVNFDLNLLDTAAQKADMLGSVYAKAFVEKSTKDAKDMRDRAFTCMRNLMGETLDAAEYVFRKNKERLDYYYSAYRSRQNAPATEPETAAV